MVITSQESADVTPLTSDAYVATLGSVSEDVLHAMLLATLEACTSAELEVWEGYQRQAAMIEAIGEYRFPGFKAYHYRVRHH